MVLHILHWQARQQAKQAVCKQIKGNNLNRVLLSRFGSSERLQLSSAEWLENGMHAKTVKFDIGKGGEAPQVNWEDRSAAIALIESKPAKSLASLLLWGGNENWNWSHDFDEVVNYLANEMIKHCKKDGRESPRGCDHTIEELAYLVARMTLHFELYNLWDLYSLEGQLLFSGIKVPANTYRQVWKKYQDAMLADVQVLVWDIDKAIGRYRAGL